MQSNWLYEDLVARREFYSINFPCILVNLSNSEDTVPYHPSFDSPFNRGVDRGMKTFSGYVSSSKYSSELLVPVTIIDCSNFLLLCHNFFPHLLTLRQLVWWIDWPLKCLLLLHHFSSTNNIFFSMPMKKVICYSLVCLLSSTWCFWGHLLNQLLSPYSPSLHKRPQRLWVSVQ